AVFQNDLRDLGVGTTKEAVRNLLFLAERKYNRYDLYAPGETFPQRLVDWLSNFDAVDRNAAMDVVRELRFFNQNEMRALAAATLQNVVTAIQSDGMSLSRASAISYMDTLQSQTEMAVADSLFIAMAERTLSSNLDPWNASANSGNSITVTPTQMVPVASCLSTDGGSSVDETTRVASLCDKYYHLFKENIHHKVGGGCKYGFGSAGLILVLYTNCPNDS